ncbi:MAG: hypothetical protein ABIO92_00025 [Chloroflexia bacterium]
MLPFPRPNALRLALLFLPILTLAGCGNPLAGIPPTPTADLAAGGSIDNHQHGEGSSGGRLVTRYGGPLISTLVAQPEKPDPGNPFAITYRLKDKAGSPVTVDRLAITHEKPMHLIVVSSDLRRFAHIHPAHQAEGRYTVDTTLPEAGKYLLFNEFFISDGTMQIERNELSTAEAPAEATVPTLTPDLNTQHEIGELSVVLTPNVQKVRRRSPVTFTLTASKDGQPVTDLEPYLGAPCHVVIISTDTRQFAHTHGDIPGGIMSSDMSGSNMASMVMPTPPARFGPGIQFTHTFMQAGMYRVWVQFGYKGEVVTTAHNVQVLK